jgi:tetratricopeptide (TPR) repeat protein
VHAEADAHVDRLVRICGGLPLALRLAAARLISRPAWSLAAFNETLADERDRLNELRQANVALRSSFEVSYQNLTPHGQLVFRCSGLFPGPDFAAPAIAALADLDLPGVSDLLEALVDASLLNSRTPGRYHLHDLIRIYAVECGQSHDTESVATQRLSRLSAWYLASADVADQVLLPGRTRVIVHHDDPDLPAPPRLADRQHALAWFETERGNLREVVRVAALRGLHSPAWQLPMVMKGFLELRRYTQDWITTHQIALESVRTDGGPFSQAQVLNALGSAYWRGERLPDAVDCYAQALDIIRTLGDRRTEAILLTNIGGIHSECGDYEAAIDALRLALRIREEVGSELDPSFALTNLGHAFHRCGRFDEALAALQDALRVRREQGNRHGEGVSLHCLADTLLGLNRLADADEAATQALAICVDQGNRYGQAAALHTLGTIRIAQQRRDDAVVHLRQAIRIYDEAGAERDRTNAAADLAAATGPVS